MSLSDLEQIPSYEWPDSAGAEIVRVITDRTAHADDRLLAAHLAQEYPGINDLMMGALSGVAGNQAESPELRSSAAIALGPAFELADLDGLAQGLDDDGLPCTPEAVNSAKAALRAVFDDKNAPDEVRRSCLETLAHAPQDWHAGAVRAAYADASNDWKLTALFCMRFITGFEDEILAALTSKDEHQRLEAIGAAGEQELQMAWPHVQAILKDSQADKLFVLAALGALPMLAPSPEIVMAILELHLASADPEILEAATEVLDMLSEDDDDDWADDDATDASAVRRPH